MKFLVTIVTMLLLQLAVSQSREQQSTRMMEGRALEKETQARGYWVDSSTGLMWAGKDNGKDIKWGTAMKYCRNLRLAGYSDWRLATIDELHGIYNAKAESFGLVGPNGDDPFPFHVKGGLFLTGNQWSSTQDPDDRGRPSGFAWYFDFGEERTIKNQTGIRYRQACAVCASFWRMIGTVHTR